MKKSLMMLTLIGCMMFISKINGFAQQKIETPKAAITALKEGNKRFVKEERKFPNQDMERVKGLVEGQNPYAAVVACSDSRVPVELLFDCGIGDIFVIRTAGNTVDDNSTQGSVDYAVNHLGVKVVVMLGHTHCGAVTAAVGKAKGDHSHDGHHHANDGKVPALISSISEVIPEYVGKPEEVNKAILKNTVYQKEQIAKQENISSEIKSGKLQVVAAIYDIETGVVKFLK